MIKAAIFDVEGTLLDSIHHRAEAWADALREFGPPVAPESLAPYVASPERDIPRRFLEPALLAEVTSERVIARYRDYWESVHSPRVSPIPEGRELVEEFRDRGIVTVLATRAHEESLPALLKLARMEDLARATAVPNGTEEEVLRAAFERAEADANECLAIVHSPSDARAAGRLGLHVVGLLSGGATKEALLAERTEHVFASVAEMRENLDDLAPIGLPSARAEAARSSKTHYLA